jgi:hypothetical protein
MAISSACSSVYEGVNARTLGLLQRLRGPLDVTGVAARERGNGDLPELAAYGVHRIEVSLRGHGEAGLHHIHVQLDELARHAHFFGHVHAAPARLLPVAQSCIEDMDAMTHGVGFLSMPEESLKTTA